MYAATNATHCALSICELEDGVCSTHLSPHEWNSVFAIVLIPILVAILVPPIARATSSCRLGEEDVRATTDTPRGMPVLATDPVLAERSELEDPGAVSGVDVDPPMYLCGVGILSLDCGLSGLLVIAFIMMAVFCVVFFEMLMSRHPCATGVGRCRTISCIAGNSLWEGYVFMFCSLSLTSVILVQRISSMFHRRRLQHTLLKTALIAGAVMLSLTAIFPEKYDVNGRSDGALGVLYTLHLTGVYGSGALLLGVPYVWFMEHWWTHRSPDRHGADRVPTSAAVFRTLYASVVFSFVVAMMFISEEVVDETMDYCATITDEAECASWPSLTPPECSAALECIGGGRASLCNEMLQPNFQCRWVETDSITAWTKLIAPDKYAKAVALEFAVLLLIICYVASFALHDIKRLLARRPSAKTMAVFEATSMLPPLVAAARASSVQTDALLPVPPPAAPAEG